MPYPCAIAEEGVEDTGAGACINPFGECRLFSMASERRVTTLIADLSSTNMAVSRVSASSKRTWYLAGTEEIKKVRDNVLKLNQQKPNNNNRLMMSKNLKYKYFYIMPCRPT